MQWLAVRHGADQVSLAEPKLKPDCGLFFLVLSKFDEKASWQFDGALAALGLQRRQADPVTDPADGLYDMQLAAGAHILPAQPARPRHALGQCGRLGRREIEPVASQVFK